MEREKLIEHVIKLGMKFPSRQRFTLVLEEGELKIFSSTNKSKIKLENEKFNNNRTLLFSGNPTALLEIRDVQSAEEYVDTYLSLIKKWKVGEKI